MAAHVPDGNRGQRFVRMQHPAVLPAAPHRYASEKRRYGRLVVVVALLIGGALVVARSWPMPAVVIYQGNDGEVEQLKQRQGAAELRPWLDADARHSVRGVPTQTAKDTCLELEHMGVVRVLAFGQGISECMAIELPADQAARQQLFRWAGIWERRVGRPAPFDSQQRYILLHTPDDPFVGSLR